MRKLNPKIRPLIYVLLIGAAVLLPAHFAYHEYVYRDSTMIEKAEHATLCYQYNYGREFHDLNDRQLIFAQKYGIQPLTDRDQTPSKHVATIESCDLYHLDNLTHSFPILVPKAKRLLDQIGTDFADSLKCKFGIEEFCPIVTSVTRTAADVKTLRRSGNGNASENSCHCYATTFDLSVQRFFKSGGIQHLEIRSAAMKQTLAEVLKNLRDQGRCLVKYERKQNCFHVTVKDPSD